MRYWIMLASVLVLVGCSSNSGEKAREAGKTQEDAASAEAKDLAKAKEVLTAALDDWVAGQVRKEHHKQPFSCYIWQTGRYMVLLGYEIKNFHQEVTGSKAKKQFSATVNLELEVKGGSPTKKQVDYFITKQDENAEWDCAGIDDR